MTAIFACLNMVMADTVCSIQGDVIVSSSKDFPAFMFEYQNNCLSLQQNYWQSLNIEPKSLHGHIDKAESDNEL